MAVRRERRWPRIAVGYAVLLLFTGALTAFLFDTASPGNRPAVIRAAVAFVAAVVLINLRSYFRGDPRWEPNSEFADVSAREPPAAKLDPGFEKLRNEVANSFGSSRYFDEILGPRLATLARRRGVREGLPLPSKHGWWGRGPSARTLSALLARIEGHGRKPS